MSDETPDARLREEAREAYHRPPDRIPREAIWASIEARLDRGGKTETPVIPLPVEGSRRTRPGPWLRGAAAAAAAAAILVLGVALGRISAPGPDGSPAGGEAGVAAASRDAGSAAGTAPSPALRVATREHLDRSGSLLAVLQADARLARGAPETREWAQGLLAETRMLLDAPLTDPAARELLADLELILAQIVVLDPVGSDAARTRAEMELILEGVEERDLMTRLHAAPDGPGRRTD